MIQFIILKCITNYHFACCFNVGRVLEQIETLLSMYEAIQHIWIAETSSCNFTYEDFRWGWFVGM